MCVHFVMCVLGLRESNWRTGLASLDHWELLLDTFVSVLYVYGGKC